MSLLQLSLPGDAAREFDEMRAELARLRLIVTEKFAGADLHVRPEDAVDVATWNRDAAAVRYLLKHAQYTEHDEDSDTRTCVGCGAISWSTHFAKCPVFYAWRSLGDPRAEESFQRGWDEAIREHVERGNTPPKKHRRVRRDGEKVPSVFSTSEITSLTDAQLDGLRDVVQNCRHTTLAISDRGAPEHFTNIRCEHCGWFVFTSGAHVLVTPEPYENPLSAAAFRLVSESQDAANQREQHAAILRGGIGEGARVLARQVSDARGMEAVEDEAWATLSAMRKGLPFNTQGEPIPFVPAPDSTV